MSFLSWPWELQVYVLGCMVMLLLIVMDRGKTTHDWNPLEKFACIALWPIAMVLGVLFVFASIFD